ncbi:CATRA system-associated protein [Micromonospora sp. WMMD1155]|uniref:CATRA system-associated protein n=1 Tax=Micromonospora sp. WMMD1155 TaxID=3016094 RepID=UPI00249BA1BA|nr:CATRA system-associated protein [Micromonospora sp. WMMD1155]WFE54891.1 hypothetical protein O7617_33025 [Micromonospora sp. WMMD1155]
MDGRWDMETLEDALDVLSDLPQWRLPAPHWERIGPILDQMGQAFAAGDDEELRDATTQLELYGPVRANRIGTKDVDGPDPSVTERQNRLVDEIGKAVPTRSASRSRDQDGGRDDRPAG